jgi:hypothetical protein
MNGLFLRQHDIEEAFRIVAPLIQQFLDSGVPKRKHLAIVVLCPEQGEPVFRRSFGNHDEWEHDYEFYASAKARVSFKHKCMSRELSLTPHLFSKDEVIYPGGVYHQGIVVAASGIESEYDEMVATWLVSAVVAVVQKRFSAFVASGQDRIP